MITVLATTNGAFEGHQVGITRRLFVQTMTAAGLGWVVGCGGETFSAEGDIFTEGDTTDQTGSSLDSRQPDGAQADVGQPDTGLPDTGLPDTGQPDTALEDTDQPDTTQSDATEPDGAQSDVADLDAGLTDSELPRDLGSDSPVDLDPDSDLADSTELGSDLDLTHHDSVELGDLGVDGPSDQGADCHPTWYYGGHYGGWVCEYGGPDLGRDYGHDLPPYGGDLGGDCSPEYGGEIEYGAGCEREYGGLFPPRSRQQRLARAKLRAGDPGLTIEWTGDRGPGLLRRLARRLSRNA